MNIELNKKAFQLKFGFRCFLNLGKLLGYKTFNEVVDKFQGFGGDELTLDQMELLEKLVIASAEAHPKYTELGYSIREVDILDELFIQPETLNQIMTAFVESFPKTEGKPQPRKTARKKQKA